MKSLVNYSSKLPSMYGEGFTFVEEVPSLDRYTMRVTRCFYHEFFSSRTAATYPTFLCMGSHMD